MDEPTTTASDEVLLACGSASAPGAVVVSSTPAAVPAEGGFDFDTLVELHASDLLLYVTHLTRCQPGDAEDIVQETFLRLHRQVMKHGASSVRDVQAFLFRAAHNLAIDAARRATQRRKLAKLMPSLFGSNNGPSPQQAAEQHESSRLALQHLHALPPELRQVVLLKIIRGLTFRQISQVTGLSVGSAAYRVNQALGELAKRMNEKNAI